MRKIKATGLRAEHAEQVRAYELAVSPEVGEESQAADARKRKRGGYH
jgi:ribosomal protein S21